MKKPISNREKVLSILILHPELNKEGIHYNIQPLKNKSSEVIYSQMRESQQYLIERCNFIVKLSEVLQRKITKTLTIRKSYSSYKIKHLLEKSRSSLGINESSISNGELITAALMTGFECKPIKDSPNVYFNMAHESLKKLL